MLPKDYMFDVFRNKRVEPDNFETNHPCDFCDSYTNAVVKIPLMFIRSFYISADRSPLICKGCLTRMIEEIDKTIVDNFEKDFQEARKDD
jgi:hypothetical protein